MIHRCVCINLPARKDRLESFMAGVPKDWTLPIPQRWPAIDGTEIDVPGWFQGGRGAWGCLQSHIALLRALDETDTLVLEDDAVFCDAFETRLSDFMRSVPDDWQLLYLGGEHCRPAVPVNAEVVRCSMTGRTHAYAVRGTHIPAVLRVLTDYADHEQPRNRWKHVDHRLAEMQHAWNVYAPSQWRVGQRGGPSDVFGQSVPERWWQTEMAA